MRALLAKELGALMPYSLAFGALLLVNGVSMLWNPDPSYVGFGTQLSDGQAECATTWILGFLVGHALVAHELRDGYVEFLDGLPTTRTRVFAAKVLAGALLMSLLVAASMTEDLVTAWLAPPPSALSPTRALLTVHALMLGTALAGLGTGLLLSWLQGLAWGVLGLAAVVAGCAGVWAPPIRAWVPVVGTLGTLEWTGRTASHPVGPVALQLALAAVAVGVSGVLFSGPGRFLTAAGAGGLGLVRGVLVGCGVLVGVPVTALVALGMVALSGGELWEGKDALQTPHFRILYAPGEEAAARDVADGLDALSEQVGALVGDPAPLELDVELLGAPTHHLGVFTGGKIRLARSADRGVLAHELTHAHAFQLAGRATWDHRDHVHFFEEGVADWVRATVLGSAPVPPAAGALYATHQARFDELVDSSRHLARHDITQSYLLGQVFTVALVDVAGPDAPGCVLRALGRVPAGRDAPGLALWYGLAATCSVDLDAVQDRWNVLLADAAQALGPIPHLSARWIPASGVLEVRDERGLSWPLHCGFRDDGDRSPEHWRYVRADAAGRCVVPTEVQVGHTFQYQVGFELPDGGDRGIVFDVWTDARAW